MISIFSTCSNPTARQDPINQALECYTELADEVVIINGGDTNLTAPDINEVKSPWPKEFNWKLFGEQFQRGYEACTGDWVLRADLDYIFHQNDFKIIRQAIKDNPEAIGLSFYKYQFILPDRYNLKSRLVVLVNKGKYGDRIRFDGGGDMCQATFDGEWINPNDVPEAGVPIYNYEKILKSKPQIAEDVGRMERAWERYYGKTQYGSYGTDEDAYRYWIKAQQGKFAKPQKEIRLEEHPKYMQETIANLKPEQFGFNGFGELNA